MSLINEALKKAQKQRTHEPHATAPAGSHPPPPPRVAKRSQPMPAQTLVIIGMMCLLLLVAIVAGAWYIFGNSTPSETIATSTTPTLKNAPVVDLPAATTPVAPVPSAPSDAPKPAASGPNDTLPAVPAQVPAASAATLPTTPATVAPTATPAPSPAATITSPLVGAPANPSNPAETPLHIDLTPASRAYVPPNPKVSAVVDLLRVSGIRASANDPKALMNDRVFRLNDLVDRGTGLRLLEITPGHLVFIDEEGATYIKNF